MGCVPMPGPQLAADHLSIDRWNELRSLRRKAMNEMGTYERRMHFDRLCQLRALYQLRGEWDSTPTLSIEDAVESGIPEPLESQLRLSLGQGFRHSIPTVCGLGNVVT